jgi:hypothetical protein
MNGIVKKLFLIPMVIWVLMFAANLTLTYYATVQAIKITTVARCFRI